MTTRYEDTANTSTDISPSYFEPGCTGSRVFIPKSGIYGTYIEWNNINSPATQLATFDFSVLADGAGPTIGVMLNGVQMSPIIVANTSGTGCATYSVSLPVVAGNNTLRVTSVGNTANIKLDYVDVTIEEVVTPPLEAKGMRFDSKSSAFDPLTGLCKTTICFKAPVGQTYNQGDLVGLFIRPNVNDEDAIDASVFDGTKACFIVPVAPAGTTVEYVAKIKTQ